MKILTRSCPICGCKNAVPIHGLKFALFDDCPMSSDFDLVSCTQCDFLFYDTPDTSDNFSDFYKHHYFSSAYTEIGSTTEVEPVISIPDDPFQLLLPYLRTDSRICEIGSGKGSLLHKFKTNGYEHVYALEPSSPCVDFMRSKLGLTAQVGTIDSRPFEGTFFDVVISTHVFEHLVDLSTAVRNIHSMLNETGIVYIEVPDLDHYADGALNPLDYITIYEHINHFTLSTLITLFNNFGFELLLSGRKLLSPDSRLPLPSLYGIFKKQTQLSNGETVTSSVDASQVISWFENYKFSKDHQLNAIAHARTPVYVYGINLFMQKMMAMTPLRDCNIKGLIDRDLNKQRKTINGMAISPPEVIKTVAPDSVVVIWGGPYCSSIINTLNSLGFSGEVLVI